MEPDLLLAGEVGKPHGLAGEVHVVPISDDPRRYEAGARLIHADGRILTVESAHSHGRRLLIKFVEANNREDAERLRGTLFVPGSERRELEPGEYWIDELAGFEVVDSNGARLGTVSRVIERPPQDLVEVETPNGLRFVPFVAEIVLEVDADARRMVLDPPMGLLD